MKSNIGFREDFEHLEKYRVETRPEIAAFFEQNNSYIIGDYIISVDGSNQKFHVMASIDENQWEHVSVSVFTSDRLPKWNEMARIKDLFWKEEAYVLQFHPAKSDKVNLVDNCLHLWRNMDYMQRVPDSLKGAFDR